MLVGLAIRDFVLIDRLSLSFESGLTVLTGETGAGKSILLGALGLALGGRGEGGLVRTDAEQASITAEFLLPSAHPARAILAEQEIATDGELVIRRTLARDGRSRAFANEQPVSVGLLRRLAETLVEIHGQFDTHGLFDQRTHRAMLDAHGGLKTLAAQVGEDWRAWAAAAEEALRLAREAESARAEETYLRDAVAELDQLAAAAGEEEALNDIRQRLQHREKLLEALNTAHRELAGERGAELAIGLARRALERVADRAGGLCDAVLEGLDRAQIELGEALSALDSAASSVEAEPRSLESVDDRIFELRRVARRYGVAPDELPALRDRLAERLGGLETEEERLAAASRRAADLKQAYVRSAESLSVARRQAAERLDAAVMRELKPLKLDRARFVTEIARLDEAGWGETGADSVSFAVATNPGQPPGPLAKIASGGELARFMLALKVVLARESAVPVLIFDEVDSGIGGATADAVGERLLRLAQSVQVLVVTHSPQVAARGTHHWQVSKRVKGGAGLTELHPLDSAGRREEIARMLSGAEITAEARAAAARLMDGGPVGSLL
jgi:DNA repair protein RecN (Recombination protein N)